MAVCVHAGLESSPRGSVADGTESPDVRKIIYTSPSKILTPVRHVS